MKTVLIHGYAGQTTMSVFRPPLDETAGFYAFRELIDNDQAVAFSWGLNTNLSFIKAVNPLSYLNVYQSEEKMVENFEVQKQLYDFLLEQNASTIICHSLGCRLIFETAKQMGLPANVERVIWVQAGLDANVSISGLFPELINFWCPWDPTLLLSQMFLHRQFRAGLTPIQGAKNVFCPLWRLPNLHTSSQKDPLLLSWLK